MPTLNLDTNISSYENKKRFRKFVMPTVRNLTRYWRSYRNKDRKTKIHIIQNQLFASSRGDTTYVMLVTQWPAWSFSRHNSLVLRQAHTNWVELSNVYRPSPTKHFIGHIGDGFLRVKWPNQQCQSTEGRHKTKLNQIQQNTKILN